MGEVNERSHFLNVVLVEAVIACIDVGQGTFARDAIIGAAGAEPNISPDPLAGMGGSAGLDSCLPAPAVVAAAGTPRPRFWSLRYVSIRMTPDDPG